MVQIGHASLDESGKISGGKAGDQTGKELCIRNWYKHSKGWIILRPKDPNKAQKIVEAVKAACANDKIGYDQTQRNTLYNKVKLLGFNPAKVNDDVETDCSALVRVCCAYAGIHTPDFNTSTESKVLMATGEFILYTDSKYTSKPDYLKAGDVLVTKTKGHTAIVISNGNMVDQPSLTLPKMPTIRAGSKRHEVTEMQRMLIIKGYVLPKYGADGDFGAETTAAVKAFQADHKLKPDGIVGNDTWAALMNA